MNKVIKYVIFFAMIVCITSVSITTKAQFYIELNTGYAAPLYYTGKNKVYELDFAHEYKYLDTAFIEYQKYNMGNGISFGSALGYQTKKGLKFGIDVFYLNNKDINLFYNNYRHEWNMQYGWGFNEVRPTRYSQYEQFIEYYSTRITLTPQIGYTCKFNKSFLDVFIGVNLSNITIYKFYIGYDERISNYSVDGLQYNPDGGLYYLDYSVSKFKYNKKIISPSIGLKYSLLLTNNLSVNLGISIWPYISFNRNNGVFYYSSIKKVIANQVTFEEELWDLKDIVPPGSIPERYNLNAINFSLGIRYTFGKANTFSAND